ncbi:hypothetical protein VOLCADRAFT_118746 [Volvox carteri f. nagariensis]|uniref:N-acetyltransferase domain-containing protein n=1 Tax=Volvox carteri f. nagariensis TaxID=3068 RepID=D8U780_VOLCA|nr:uncharacterized protein VOLCADRAFT_118746 [Volvox carteri f. nagariensis]EFJ44376.1 hypothetical protein VOLCADRAFT_118746 [Volvox carteri f. nagariensis]|eukprot:XP_002954483.1 hypothetical protein VOLCADRAFT_118746 [Volvox carteri f. nagariensis]
MRSVVEIDDQRALAQIVHNIWMRRRTLIAESLRIRPIERGDVQAASIVLTRAFATSAEAVPLAEVLKDIDSMLLADPGPAADSSSDPSTTSGRSVAPDGYFLVARLYPRDPQQAPLPPGQDSRLVGTAAVSFSAESQPVRRLPPVNLPPSGGAYVSNMAVDPRVRRRGVARALLTACEELVWTAGRREVWLHVREVDAAARTLYDSAGYVAAAKDSWLDTIKHGGMRPRILMRKELHKNSC